MYAGSCAGYCGYQSCYCDHVCKYRGDCCIDYHEVCFDSAKRFWVSMQISLISACVEKDLLQKRLRSAEELLSEAQFELYLGFKIEKLPADFLLTF